MKSQAAQVFLSAVLYTAVLCSIVVCIGVVCIVDLLQRNHDSSNEGSMSLKDIIEREGVVQELLEIKMSIKMEKTKLENYVKGRFPRIQNLDDNAYSDKLKHMFLHIKNLPQEFQHTLNEEIRHILNSRSGLQLIDELRTFKSIVPMLGAHFRTYEIDKEIRTMEAAAEVENKPLEIKIRKLLGDLQKNDLKLHELFEKAQTSSEPCYSAPRFTQNYIEEKGDFRDTLDLITRYLEQANESFQVLQQSDLYFEKRPILMDLANHVQSINANTARYMRLMDKESFRC